MGAKTTISGNLGGDPELRYTKVNTGAGDEDRAVCNFNVYQSHDRKNKDTGDYEDAGGFWVRVSVWGRQAEQCAKILKKGFPVTVEGELYTHSWVDTDQTARLDFRLDAERDGVSVKLYRIDSIAMMASKPPAGE